jgi:RimK family alpha-L-glutamate ligase
MTAYEQLGPDVVLKPLFGSEGRGMTRISDRSLVERACMLISRLGAVIYMQRFVPHGGRDWRLLVVGPDVLAMERRNPDQWRTNMRQGGQPFPLKLTEPLEGMARRAAAAVGARWAGVDILPSDNGEWYVLEVNAVPGWRGLAEVTQVDVPRLMWNDLHRAARGE